MGSRIYNRSIGGAMMALCLCQGAGVEAKEPLRLKPSSPWNIHYAEDSCRMGRSFGEGDQKVVMLADRYQPGDMLRMSFVGKPAYTRVDQGEVDIRFGPNESVQKIAFFPASTSDNTPSVLTRSGIRIAPRSDAEMAAQAAAFEAGQYDFKLSDITPEQETAVTFIEVGRPVRYPFILETGSLGPPLAALRKCTDELLDHWGIDVAKHASLSRRVTPKNNPGKWMTPRDYPMQMALQGKRAIVQFRLVIDAVGVPSSCHIQQSTRPKAFDDAVCAAIMRNARFEPALDAEGKPLASYWLNTVIFSL